MTLEEEIPGDSAMDSSLYYGDNLKLMKFLIEKRDMAGRIRLIYIDPPFFSKSSYDAVVRVDGKNIRHPAYDDKWQNGMYDYLKQLTSRLILMRELLADDGMIWLHLDWHVVHYARVIMDEIFGESRFVNEIIWTYKSGGSSKKRFARKHDNILVYSRSSRYKFNVLQEKSYNRQFKPYRFKGVKEYRDELGWYTMVNMKDVWQIDMVGRTSAERTGYATQKPEQLLERIIESCTDPGDICADFFCGSGTLPAVAARMGRPFIACDQGRLAIESTLGRLCSQNARVSLYGSDSEQAGHVSFDIDLKLTSDELLAADKRLLKVELSGIRAHRLPGKLDKTAKSTVKSAAKKDPLALVEAWSIDFDFDGRVHRPDQVFIRTKDKLQASWEKIVPAESRTISVKVVDVMGNVAYYRREMEQ